LQPTMRSAEARPNTRDVRMGANLAIPLCGSEKNRLLRKILLFLALLTGSTACLSDADCKNDCQCQQRGLCGAKGNTCKATKDEHCRASQTCKLWGNCVAREGKCVAGSDEDCAASGACKSSGHCSLKGDRCGR
jgi:hypothetical protein